jgi:hypothetical protein
LSAQIAPKLRWIAWFDLAVTALFIFPPVAAAFLGSLLQMERHAFGPARALPLPAAPWFLFISLTGVLGVVWAAARLITNDDRLVMLDACARLGVATLLVHALFFGGLPLVFVAFIGTELFGSVATWFVLRKTFR